jgi:hypothetical protein
LSLISPCLMKMRSVHMSFPFLPKKNLDIKCPGTPFLSLVDAAFSPVHEGQPANDIGRGLLTSGSPYRPAFPFVRTVACSAFIPGYSGGSATDFHRLPSTREFFHSIFKMHCQTRTVEFSKRRAMLLLKSVANAFSCARGDYWFLLNPFCFPSASTTAS